MNALELLHLAGAFPWPGYLLCWKYMLLTSLYPSVWEHLVILFAMYY